MLVSQIFNTPHYTNQSSWPYHRVVIRPATLLTLHFNVVTLQHVKVMVLVRRIRWFVSLRLGDECLRCIG